MAKASIFGNKALVKENLMAEIKAYRNLSTKLALLLWILSFVGHYTYTVAMTDPINVEINESLFKSAQFSLVFALIGYCFGAVSGANLQRTRLEAIGKQKESRKRFLEEQISIRQAKLESM